MTSLGIGDEDTIFAVASGAGRAAITVVRISGAQAGPLLDRLCRRPPARMALLRTLRSRGGEVLDRALVLWFPGPGSYTGEDSAELHLHGGPAVLASVSAALAAEGARPAEAGEFTRRAFIHGRLDLLEAEAIADLVAAETDAQRLQALRQMGGALGDLYRGWATRLTILLVDQEAQIDFPDEDLPANSESRIASTIATLAAEIDAHLNDGHRGEKLRDGLVFAVTGPPNAGKSTLINALARREVAIVSPMPGTTRDVIEVCLDIGGVPVTLLDTAGLRDGADAVEAEGVRRARARAAAADLVVAVVDATAPAEPEAPMGVGLLRVATKVDLAPAPPNTDVGVSAPTGVGLGDLRSRLATTAQRLTAASGPPSLTRPRHRAALTEAAEHLYHAAETLLPELCGEDLRLALRALGRITGQVGVEDVLDSVFRQFCIGK